MSVHQSSHQLMDTPIANTKLPKVTNSLHSIHAASGRRISRSKIPVASSMSGTAEAPRPSWQSLPIRHVLESQQFDKVSTLAQNEGNLEPSEAALQGAAGWHAII